MERQGGSVKNLRSCTEEADLVERLKDQRITGFNAQMQVREEAAKEIERLNGLLSGDASLVSAIPGDHGLDMGIKHPLVALMADSLAKMVDGNNYVEMSMSHQQTGDSYTISCQRQSRPTPHELRKRAEEERDTYKELLWQLYEGLYGHRKAENIDPFKTAVGGALELKKAWYERYGT